MGLSARTVQLLLRRAQQAQRREAVVAASSHSALNRARQTSHLLHDFIAERQQQQRAQQGQAVGVGMLRIASGFAAKLHRAVASQDITVAGLGQTHASNIRNLLAAGQRVETMRHLQQSLQREQRQRAELAEQRRTDEAAARMKRQESDSGSG